MAGKILTENVSVEMKFAAAYKMQIYHFWKLFASLSCMFRRKQWINSHQHRGMSFREKKINFDLHYDFRTSVMAQIIIIIQLLNDEIQSHYGLKGDTCCFFLICVHLAFSGMQFILLHYMP